MAEKLLYDKKFFETVIKPTAENSVESVLNVLKNCYHGQIHSAVDLGCGTGTWLKGIKDIFGGDVRARGYDGDYVDREVLAILEDEFIPWDLQVKVTDEEKYDIAISLEVAEHLPEEAANTFVDSLTGLSDLILFSAALPNQGGTGHVNEQPLSYWVNLFDKRDYELFDVIRPYIWDDIDVNYWYKQNIVLFVKRSSAAISLIEDTGKRIVDIVHPGLLQIKENNLTSIGPQYLQRKYEQIALVRDLFDSLPEKGIAIRMGGYHTKKLLSLIGKNNRSKIEVIIDHNTNCQCCKEGYPIVQLEEIPKWNNIKVVILSSFKERDVLIEESKLYPSGIEVIDLYQYLEQQGCFYNAEFF